MYWNRRSCMNKLFTLKRERGQTLEETNQSTKEQGWLPVNEFPQDRRMVNFEN